MAKKKTSSLTKGQKIGIGVGVVVILGVLGWGLYRRKKLKLAKEDCEKNDGVFIQPVGFKGFFDTKGKCNKKVEKEEEPPEIKEAYDNLLFETNKSIIKSSSFDSLNELAEYLKSVPENTLKLVGHTDNVGSDSNNMTLSKNRANSVKDFLVGKGVSDSQISTEGKGETQPIESNDTNDGRAKNRRVEFILTNG